MCLDDTFVGSLLDGLGVGTLSQQQSDGTEYDTLSRSCLTGYHRETRMQLYVKRVNQREVAYI